jgi:hypothetical protein
MTIEPGLVMGASGEHVDSLHGALTVIGLQIDELEREDQRFGPSTVAAVIKLQALAGIAQTGTVDENTSIVLDVALDRLGVRPGESGYAARAAPYVVSGKVTNLNGEPKARATVVAYDCDLRSAQEIGRGITDAAGEYRISYTADALLEGRKEADLKVEVHNRAGQPVLSSIVNFGAARQFVVDLPLGGLEHSQPSELTSVTDSVTPLLGRLQPVELEENSQNRDLSFLAGQTSIARERLGYWAVAHRLSSDTELPPELFYALFRAKVPADAHVTVLAASTEGADLETNAQRLLSGILATSPTTLRTALETAVMANIVPASYGTRVRRDLKQIGTLASKAALDSAKGFGKTSLSNLLDTLSVAPGLQETFATLYSSAVGAERRTFWSDLPNHSDFTKETVADLKFGLIVGRMTSGHLPLVNELLAKRRDGTITTARDLARLTAAEWAKLLRKTGDDGKTVGVPGFIDGETIRTRRDTYAAMLERRFTQAYPTAAFSARIATDRATPFANAAPTAAFLDANSSVDLRHTNVDALGQKLPIDAGVRDTLLAAQRLVKVHPAYSVMRTLMADGIQSAQQVYVMGRDGFVSKFGAHPALGTTEAARMWARAEQTYAVALALALKLNATLDYASPLAAGNVLPENLEEMVASFPNLQTLFGSESLCDCEDCESVLGAAAYLVDLLEFLKHRQAGGGQNVRDVLIARRPDIAQIQLSCPNTDTELPYIDLVNELLEDAVAPPADPVKAAAARQTRLSTPELNANPEYVNEATYVKLATAVYPWTLPFDFELAEVRGYLEQLNLNRSNLIRAFEKPAGYPSAQAEALAHEHLGLSALEIDILTGGALAAGFSSWDYWGLTSAANTIVDPYDPTATLSGTWIDVLTQVRVLLSRAGLDYTALTRLLNTIFVNGDGEVTINATPPDSCDVATMTIDGLTQDVLDRIHRFVRLQRVLGWDTYDLDNAIGLLQSQGAPGLSQLNGLLLRQFAAVQAAMKRYPLTVSSAVALFAPAAGAPTIATRDIPTLPGEDERYSLYHDLFENFTVLDAPDPIFKLNEGGTEIDAIAAAPTLADHSAALVATFQVSQSDLQLAITSFTDGKLTLANLSTLYRHTQLASALGVTIHELVELLAIAETPIAAPPHYETVDPFDGQRPESLAAFADLYVALKTSGLSIEQVDYVVRGLDDGNGVAPDPVEVGTLLLTLYNGLAKIAAEHAFKPDPTGTATRKELAKLIAPADLNTAMAILDGSSTLSGAARNTFIATALGSYIDAAIAQAKLVGGAALTEGQPRFEYVLRELLAHETRRLSTGLVVQSLAQALGLATATTAQLLQTWFPSPLAPGSFVIADFLALRSVPLASTTAPISPDDPGFKAYFTTYASLAKVALIVSQLSLSADDIAWWHTNGVAAGWLDPTTLPTTPQDGAAGRFASLFRLITARNVRDGVPAPNSSFQLLFSIASGATTKSECLTALATMTNWPAASLETLCGDPANLADLGELSLVYPEDFRSEIALARLLPCFRIVVRTGIPADVTSWIGSTVNVAAAAAVKQSVKANYPEQQWLTLAKQLRDPLREAQRDALVSYLLANPPAGVGRWLDPEDVFAHFLIDVEMGAGMGTSRIVQAIAAVQLFVQRCFLSLEPGVTTDATVDGDWLQWQWLSQYRLWQANREVFLFPEEWIDPTLRSNSSPFFADLEQDLKHGDLTDEVAETGLQNYLEKLESVARLDVCATFHDFEQDHDVLHVLARTQGSPPVYYTRRWVDSSRWTAWTKVDLDIASDHVLPLVWNGKPYIFWAIVSSKADRRGQPLPSAQTSSVPPDPPKMHLDVQLAWSQFKKGKWQAKQTAPQTLVFQGEPSVRDWESWDVTLKSSFNGSLLEIDVFLADTYRNFGGVLNKGLVWAGESIDDSVRNHVGAYLLGGSANGIEAFLETEYFYSLDDVGGASVTEVGELPSWLLKPKLAAPANSSFDGDWIAPESTDAISPTRRRVGPMVTSCQLYDTLPSEVVLQSADYFRLVVPHQNPTFDSTLPFFYRDAAREYFVIPTDYYQNGNYFFTTPPSGVYNPFFRAEYNFSPFYHPFMPLLVNQLNFGGLRALYNGQLQLDPAGVAGTGTFDFAKYYDPTPIVLQPYPNEGIDFDTKAGYSLYNWELFFHAPFLIANSLSTNQHFEHAKKWYERIFNPATANADPIPQRYWVTKPFHEMTATQVAGQEITKLMQEINQGDTDLERQVADWRSDPFDPDMIAQLRPVAYQRAIVRKYTENLIKWADQQFAQGTRESINSATQLYVLAGDLHGPRPQIVPPRVDPIVKTYAELAAGTIDVFSNELVAAENAIPPVKVNTPTPPVSPSLPTLNTLYFRIPANGRLLQVWTTISDRLFKIRHGLTIEGLARHLSLFARPIDPGMLVATAAAGVDLASILSDIDAATPPYRFRTMIRHAIELCEQVRSYGSELLAALEKGDAERLAQIRSGAENKLQAAIADVRSRQVDAATQEIEVLAKSKQSFLDRANFYSGRAFMNEWEAAALVLRAAALIPQTVAGVLESASGVAHAFPNIEAGAAGFGGSPTVTVTIGGANVGNAAGAGASVARMLAGIIQTGAELSGTLGQYHQRRDDWGLQATLASDDIARVDAETVMAQIRIDVAKKEKGAQDIAAQEASDVDDFLHSKFTNDQLYEWMVDQTSTTYFQAYQLAYSTAKAAEQCFRRELAISDSQYIQFGYWDSLRQGLSAGDKLLYDLRRLESAYLTDNDRELELSETVSLVHLDPYALVELRENHSCLVQLPELMFDLENPGHYLRRLKSVAVTVPSVVGPYGGVSLTLSLLDNQIRASTDTGAGYPRVAGTDLRFVDDPGGSQQIVTSSGQNDSGLFDLRMEDERYLPFEGTGAISTWRLTLNNVFPQFDYSTISDVMLHLRYTARDGGAVFSSVVATSARSRVNAIALAESRRGLYRLLSTRHDYAAGWAKFLNPAPGADQTLTLALPPERFPLFTRGLDIRVVAIDVVATIADTDDYTLELTPPSGPPQTVTLSPDATLGGAHHKELVFNPKVDLGRAPTPPAISPPAFSVRLQKANAGDWQSLARSDIADLLLVVSYQVS